MRPFHIAALLLQFQLFRGAASFPHNYIENKDVCFQEAGCPCPALSSLQTCRAYVLRMTLLNPQHVEKAVVAPLLGNVSAMTQLWDLASRALR
ncbi:hypothetical protein BJ741DRAFT_632144 [Chytriomyces cf. hyalinus JEL632]|nr:hypothetical protein BJ741DRAFT_632144 [Chytriomyces cf. hyalinus JEL632]